MTGERTTIEPLGRADRVWVLPAILENFGGDPLITTGGSHHLQDLEGFKIIADGLPAGFAHFVLARGECEIVTLVSLVRLRGIGTALLEAVCDKARQSACSRVWVTTTNDNVEALGFYQRRGFHLVAVHPDAMDRVREVKPDLPLLGKDRIPLRDVLELEMRLEGTLF